MFDSLWKLKQILLIEFKCCISPFGGIPIEANCFSFACIWLVNNIFSVPSVCAIVYIIHDASEAQDSRTNNINSTMIASHQQYLRWSYQSKWIKTYWKTREKKENTTMVNSRRSTIGLLSGTMQREILFVKFEAIETDTQNVSPISSIFLTACTMNADSTRTLKHNGNMDSWWQCATEWITDES